MDERGISSNRVLMINPGTNNSFSLHIKTLRKGKKRGLKRPNFEEQEEKEMRVEGGGEHQERILVSVRLRPLNPKEIQINDFADWECTNPTTILFKNYLGERSMYPNAYHFDRVFGFDSSTKQVYEEAAKEVALSVLHGINSSVFAYGQTSSGKTYTMGGITQHTVQDIYDYIIQHNEREFVLKFSAMEIYNELVKDLLSSDPVPLRLLDDPERGTVVERLTEETVIDKSHLLELIAVCESQRQVGETSLNETSSRSHQIIKLTIESTARQFGGGNSSILAACVNFVDLAGSERTSQTLTTGSRLKEGSHINRSLLTLGKVIRSLSKGRNVHVPYRDSKLTRILHNSLGGNARTAIICTMSPAHSHLEQSRNTLLFASCAKEVTTNAQVNIVMSDKALVKHLKKELARLENDLKNMSSVSSKGDMASVLKEKEHQIEMMDKEIRELSHQRDLAQSKVEELLQSSVEKNQFPLPLLNTRSHHQRSKSREKISWQDDLSVTSDATDYERLDMDLATSESTQYIDYHTSFDLTTDPSNLLENVDDSFLINGSSPKLLSPTSSDHLHPSPGWEEMIASGRPDEDSDDNCKEVRCIDPVNISPLRNEKGGEIFDGKRKDEIENENELNHSDVEYDALVKKIKELHNTINILVNRNLQEHPSPCSTEPQEIKLEFRGMGFSRSRSCNAAITTSDTSLTALKNVVVHHRDQSFGGFEKQVISGRPKGLPRVPDYVNENSSTIAPPTSIRACIMGEMEQEGKYSDASDSSSIYSSLAGTNEDSKPEDYKQIGFEMDTVQPKDSKISGESEGDIGSFMMQMRDCMSDGTPSTQQSPLSWQEEFEIQRFKIIELWHAFHVPLIHRTYFFLLFKGDPSDQLYIEVELRRLSFIKQRFAQGQKIVMDGQVFTPSSSMRALNQEREVLVRQMYKMIPYDDRESVFGKWGIDLNSKQRRLQLSRRIWTEPKDMEHIKESAELVAKLVGFEDDGQVPKEMFVGPSFTPKTLNRRSYSWRSTAF